jgi:hypothetical protein
MTHREVAAEKRLRKVTYHILHYFGKIFLTSPLGKKRERWLIADLFPILNLLNQLIKDG